MISSYKKITIKKIVNELIDKYLTEEIKEMKKNFTREEF